MSSSRSEDVVTNKNSNEPPPPPPRSVERAFTWLDRFQESLERKFQSPDGRGISNTKRTQFWSYLLRGMQKVNGDGDAVTRLLCLVGIATYIDRAALLPPRAVHTMMQSLQQASHQVKNMNLVPDLLSSEQQDDSDKNKKNDVSWNDVLVPQLVKSAIEALPVEVVVEDKEIRSYLIDHVLLKLVHHNVYIHGWVKDDAAELKDDWKYDFYDLAMLLQDRMKLSQAEQAYVLQEQSGEAM